MMEPTEIDNKFLIETAPCNDEGFSIDVPDCGDNSFLISSEK